MSPQRPVSSAAAPAAHLPERDNAHRLTFAHRSLAQQVRFGSGQAAAHVAAVLDELHARRVMVIAASAEAELADRITAGLPVAVRHDEVVMHVPVAVAERARAVAADRTVDVLLSVGGGSTTGLAKAVALTTGLPIVAVPTTYAGSEATNVWGLTEPGRKTTGVDDRVLPVAVVYDAALTTSLPLEMSVASGMNALAHCIDSMWAPHADPINQALAIEGIAALQSGLPLVVADPTGLEGREQLLYAAYLAATAFASAGSGLHHKICHVLGGMFDLPHAQTHAVVLPYVLALNGPSVPEAQRRIAAALGAADALEGLQRLRFTLGAPRALGDYGFTESNIPAAVEAISAVVPAENPRHVSADDLHTLLVAALTGSDPTTLFDRPTAGSLPLTAGMTSDDQQRREQAVLEQVVASFEPAENPRLKYLMQTLARHLHGFVRDVRLTDAEWATTIEFLTEAGHITDDKRQEFILLSDVLGVTMQTIAVNDQAEPDATEATILGPFFVAGSPLISLGGDISGGAAGQPCWVEGTITDTQGNPVRDALIEVWECDEDGYYDVQYPDDRIAARGHLSTDRQGAYRFWALTPVRYPIPHDGPVGRLLDAVGRSPMRAPHLHFMVSAPSFRTLVTHIFVAGNDTQAGDAVFGVKESLIKTFEMHAAGTPTPDGRDLGGRDWSSTRFDIVLARQAT